MTSGAIVILMNEQTPFQQDSVSTKKYKRLRSITLSLALVIALLAGGLAGLVLKYKNDTQTRDSAIDQPAVENIAPEPAQEAEVPVNENAGPYIADGHLVVPHWKAKFKLSDELTDYGYSVNPDQLGASFGKYHVGLTAIHKSDLIERPIQKYYPGIGDCSIVTVSKTDKDLTNVGGPKKIVKSGEESYVIYDYTSTTNCPVKEGPSLFTNEHYEKVSAALIEIFSNPIEL